MKALVPIALALAPVLFLATPAFAQLKCPEWQPVVKAAVAAQVPRYEWRNAATQPGQTTLYLDGKQVGAFDMREFYFRPYDAKTDAWGDKCKPPIEPPCFGVNHEKIAVEKYSLNGKEVSQRTAKAAVEDTLEDDSQKLRVTIIAQAEEKRKAIADDIKKIPDTGFTIHAYDPKAWELGCGFVTPGDPTIYCQAPNGKVLHRQDDYSGGAEAAIAALRKAKAGYDPKKDPDLRKPQTPPLDGKGFASALLAVLVGLFMVAVVVPKLERKLTHASV